MFHVVHRQFTWWPIRLDDGAGELKVVLLPADMLLDDIDVLDYIVDWRGIVDKDGQLPFTRAYLNRACLLPEFSKIVRQAFIDAQQRADDENLLNCLNWIFCTDDINENYCRKSCMWKRKSNDYCADCPRPSLYENNANALAVFLRSMTQLRFGPRGPVGIDYSAAMLVADVLGIELKSGDFNKIQLLEQRYLEIVQQWQKKSS